MHDFASQLALLALALIACLGVPVLLCGFVFGALRWTTGPLLEAGRSTQPTSTFLLTDLIWLVLQLQMAMALGAYAFPASMMPTHARLWAIVLMSLPVLLFWLASLLIVSRAGIRRPLRRAAVFVVLLPGVAATVLGLPLVTMGFLGSLDQRPTETSPWQLGGIMAALVAFALSLRWIARWACATPKSPLP